MIRKAGGGGGGGGFTKREGEGEKGGRKISSHAEVGVGGAKSFEVGFKQ